MRRFPRHIAFLLVAASLVTAACGPAASSPSPAAPAPSAAPSGAGSPAAPAPGDAAGIGRAYVEALAAGDVEAAEAMQDATMRSAAPAATLAQLWTQVVAQFGAYTGTGEVTTAPADEFVNATVETRFEQATVPLIVTVTAAGEVAGFHFGEPEPAEGSPAASAAASPAASASAPEYVDPSAFTETEVTVGTAPWALPGTLSMPVGEGPFPAVVLVAGSGPHDRDETIGPNAPLRDLAWGLASQGIAVLRYEKRTKAYASELAAQADTVTVREEVVDDAVAAVDLLRSTPGVDPDRVVVAGHSLGGYLAPRIAAEADGRVAGIALLAGSISPLQRLVEQQLRHLASPEVGADPQAAAMLEALPEQLALVESPALSPSTPASQLPLGIPAAYWLDLRGYDAGATARSLSVPVFIAQGGRDYQVPPSELAAWRDALAGRDAVTLHEYPALNHLLIPGEGASTPAEYAVPGHVDAALVADLAEWIKVRE